MSQNLLSLTLTDAQLQTIDNALIALEGALSGLISLEPDERRSLFKMGDKSEAFCRQALAALVQNPQIVPPSMSVPEGQADLDALDRLRPRLHRLQRLTERAEDSETALGSDLMALSLEGYALLKVSGRNQGLETLRGDLANRFRARRRAVKEPATA